MLYRGPHLIQTIGKTIRRGWQAQCLCCQTAYTLPVHGQARGTRGGNDARQSFALDLFQHAGGDGLDLRHDDMRFLLFDQRAQCGAVCHVDHVGTMRNLVAGRVCIAIDCDGFHAEALQCDDDFFAQLAAAEQHDFGGGRSERRADGELFHLGCHAV